MPERGTLLIDKAKSLINYNPSFSLEKGYPKYIKWYKELFEKNPEIISSKWKMVNQLSLVYLV